MTAGLKSALPWILQHVLLIYISEPDEINQPRPGVGYFVNKKEIVKTHISKPHLSILKNNIQKKHYKTLKFKACQYNKSFSQ